MLLEEDVAMAVETHTSPTAEFPPSAMSWLAQPEPAPAEPRDLPAEDDALLAPPIPWPRVFPPL